MHTVSPLRLVSVALLVALCGCATTGRMPAPRGVTAGKEPATRPGVIQGHLRAPGRATAVSMSEYVIYVDPLKNPPPPPPVARSKSRSSKKGAGPAPPRPPRVQLGLEPGGFAPRVVAVAPGDSVDFVNRDRRFHSAFSVSAARRFDLGSIPPRGRRSLRFDKAGTVRVFCTLHSDSSAYVFVAPSKVFTRPDATGSFELPELPAGSYRVRAWHPRHGERSWPVDLPRFGTAIDLRF